MAERCTNPDDVIHPAAVSMRTCRRRHVHLRFHDDQDRVIAEVIFDRECAGDFVSDLIRLCVQIDACAIIEDGCAGRA
jgi:hypothetical protein